MEKLQLIDDQQCCACGMDNPHGLRIEWKIEGMTMTAHFIPEQKYQGWKGILHGGIIATLSAITAVFVRLGRLLERLDLVDERLGRLENRQGGGNGSVRGPPPSAPPNPSWRVRPAR